MTDFKLCTMKHRRTGEPHIVYYDELGQLVTYTDKEGHSVADHRWVSDNLRHVNAPDVARRYLAGTELNPVIVKRLSRNMNKWSDRQET